MKRQTHLDILRVMATYAVVLLHTISSMNDGSRNTLLLAYDGIVRWAVPMFIMISGALFLNPEKECSIGAMWKKNILRMILALLFWSAMYCIWEAVYNHRDANYIVQTMITGYWHMWFLFMIVGLYILTPVIRLIAKDRRICGYYLLVAFIIVFGKNTIKSTLVYTSFAHNETINSIFTNYDNMELHFIIGYVPYFLLGYYLNSKEFSKRERSVAYTLGILGFLWTIFGNMYLTNKQGSLVQNFSSPLKWPALFQCIGLFVFFKTHFSNKESKIVVRLSKYTFGAYMIHVMIRNSLDRFWGLKPEHYDFLLWVPILAFLIFVISMIVSATVNHIPILKKYVV